MGEKKTASAKKPALIVLSVLLVAVAVIFAANHFISKDTISGDVSGQAAFADDSNDAEAITTTKHTAVKKSEISEENEEALPTEAQEDVSAVTDSTTSAKSTTTKTTVQTTTAPDGKLPNGSPSQLMKGYTATYRWKASNVISNVVAERITVNLPVYIDGKKTEKTEKRYMYLAEIDTKPSRVVYPAASQFTKYKLNYMDRLVKAYESATKQDILFACTNEMCARDDKNLYGNVFYNGNDTLTATVIKNGKVAQSGEASKDSLVINKNGTWSFPVKVSMSNCSDLIHSGTIASVSYTYPVIWEGKRYNHPEAGEETGIWTNHTIADLDSNVNHTLIGKVTDDKYIVAIGMDFGYGYLAEFMMNNLGVQYAYWANGGVAAGMYIKGYGIVTPNNYFVHGDLFCVR